MLFISTTTILASANMFGQSYLLTKGGPGTETRTVIMYIADQGLSQNNMAPAAAMSYILFAVLADHQRDQLPPPARTCREGREMTATTTNWPVATPTRQRSLRDGRPAARRRGRRSCTSS